MNQFFRHRPTFLFSGATAVGSASPSAATAQTDLSSGTGGSSDMKAMFEQGMSDQKAMYKEGMQESIQKDELQTQGDAALKTLKAISIS